MPLGAEDFKSKRDVGSGMAWIGAIPHGERDWGILDVGGWCGLVGVIWGCCVPVLYPHAPRCGASFAGRLAAVVQARERTLKVGPRRGLAGLAQLAAIRQRVASYAAF